MKQLRTILMALVLLISLSACSTALPEVPDQEAILALLPEELQTVTIMDRQQEVTTTLEITHRDTDLTHQTDDVTCWITLEGESFTLSYGCVLSFAYIRSTGWTIRSYEITEQDLPEVEEAAWAEILFAENLALLQQSGFDNLSLQSQTWTEGSYCQVYSTGDRGSFLESQATVTLSGTLEQSGTGFAYDWSRTIVQGEATYTSLLEGTVWYLLDEEGSFELAFLVESADGDTLTVRGVLRNKSRWGKISQSQVSSATVEWSVTAHGSITFTLAPFGEEELICYLAEDSQWVTQQELYYTALEQKSLPDSGKLSELMTLEVSSSIWDTLIPDVQEVQEPEIGTDTQEQAEEETSSGLWDTLVEFWNRLF